MPCSITRRTLEDWEAGRRTPPAYVLQLLDRAVMWRTDKSPRFVKERDYWTLYIGEASCGCARLADMADVLVEYEDMIANEPDEFVRRITLCK